MMIPSALPVSPAMNKSELRSTYLGRRRELSASDIEKKSRQIAERFFSEFDIAAIRTIHCFISIPRLREVDTSLIYERVWREFPHIGVVAPRMNRASGELNSIEFNPGSALIENAWGIREPAGPLVDPSQIDVVIVPLLCYDRNGNRVGYGKGLYDKFLSKCRADCRKIGISFFSPFDKIDEVDEYDVLLDACVTPEAIYSFHPTM